MPGKKLLVADDSLTIQKVIRLALSNEGYEIQTVSDGDDAVQQISLFRPDIVLIDVSLPGQSAFDVKRTVNGLEDLKSVRFVLMSSAFERIDEKQLASLVFDGRLTKPFDPAHLRQVLSGVLAKAPTQGTGLTPTAPIPTALVTPPPQAPTHGSPFGIPPRPASGAAAQAPSFTPPAPPPQAPPMPEFAPPEAPADDFSIPESPDEGPTAPPPGLIAEEDNYGPKYIPTPPSPQEEVTQPFLNPFQSGRQPAPPAQNLMTPKPDSLWDDHDSRFDAPPAPPPPPPAQARAAAKPAPAPAAPETGDDIRHLTESTIRMSGLDDFEWSVSEPSLKPHGAFGEEVESNFPIGDTAAPPQGRIPDSNDFAEEEEATEFIAAPGAAGLPQITTGSYTPPPAPGKAAARPAPPPAPPAAAFRPEPPRAAPAQAPSLDSAEIERIVRTQVQETLEKLAQKILPEVAEKVIKAEIHRMLSELP